MFPRSLLHRMSMAMTAGSLAWIAGCHTPCACDRSAVSAKVEQRTGQSLANSSVCGQPIFPYGVNPAEKLTEEQAVLIGLWNNAAFQELLADLGIARGDLIQAGLLPNPEFVYLFSAPDKPFRYALDVPIEAFWLRPIRIAAAQRETERVCERLTQSALDLIRDVRQAYADVLLAKGRLRVAQDAVAIRSQIFKLADARFQAGDTSPQEAATARIDALTADQDVTRIRYDVSIAEERLRQLLAMGAERTPIVLDDAAPPTRKDLEVESLLAEAVESRPDALAAQEAVAAAAERLRLAKLVWFKVLGILDATSGRSKGHEFGPALRFTVPIFNWNQGNIARAEAELEKAERQRQTVRNQIIQDVHQAHFRYQQARAELAILDEKVRPEVEAAIRRAETAYREGNTPYVVVLETTRQLLDSRLRQAQLQAEVRRSWAELERSIGRHIDAAPVIDEKSDKKSP